MKSILLFLLFVYLSPVVLMRAPPALAANRLADVRARIADDQKVVISNPKFLSLVFFQMDQPFRVRLEALNTHINHTIRPIKEPANQDYWQSASETLERGSGDCEDYALLKLQVLRQMGFNPDALRIVVVQVPFRLFSYHAVLSVYLDGEWLILDNMNDQIVNQNDMRYWLVRYLQIL